MWAVLFASGHSGIQMPTTSLPTVLSSSDYVLPMRQMASSMWTLKSLTPHLPT